MARRAQRLLDQIEQDVLDNTASLADALRNVVVLGGRSGSVELREWASRELRGYKSEEIHSRERVANSIAADYQGSRL